MTLEAWALFCLTEAVLCLNPGPSTLVVISLSMTRGASEGVRATLGVLVANAIYFAIAASGLVALHAASGRAFSLIKWSGAAYLVWMGLRMIRASFRSPQPAREARPQQGSAFARGFVAQGANPNLLVYFGAILPQFIDARAALAPQVGILAASSFLIEFGVLAAYAGLSGQAGRRSGSRFRALLERIGGGLLIGAAAGLARVERG